MEMGTDWVFTPYTAVLFATAVLSICVAFIVLIRRKSAGADTFILLMFAVAEWALASGLESSSIRIEDKILWSKVEYLGAVLSPTLFMIFTLEYRQVTRFLTPRYLILYSIVPLAALAATMTNELHGLIWNSYTYQSNSLNTVIYGHGIGFFVLIAYDYLVLLVGMLVMLAGWRSAHHTYRQQIGIILFGSLFPFVGGLFYSLGLNPFPGLDITPITFLFTGVVIMFGVFRFRLFDLVPVARHLLIEYMKDGVFVLNEEGNLADLNPAAERYLNIQARDCLGKPITDLLQSWPLPIRRFETPIEAHAEITTTETPPHFFEVHIHPLRRHRKISGRLVVFHDITNRRQAERDLARQNEELSIINRINLAVTAGLDMAQTIKTLHEQCSLVVPIDVFYVALYNEERGLISVPVYYEHGNYQEGTLRDLKERPGTIGNIIHTRRTLYQRDGIAGVTGPLNRQPDTEKRGKSYVGIPLTVCDKVVGVLCIQSYRPSAYRDDQIHLLERIAAYAASAIENARLYAEVQRMAIVDELTGIYNYRGLLEFGGREVERARRFNHPLTALFFDIDGFRQFNNLYSHVTGNLVLQAIARTTRKALRAVDVFSRYGGDEFVILLPETEMEGARQTAHRVYDSVAAIKIPLDQEELGVTISIGIAPLTNEVNSFTDLIERASRAEHTAKNGKLGVAAFTGSEAEPPTPGEDQAEE